MIRRKSTFGKFGDEGLKVHDIVLIRIMTGFGIIGTVNVMRIEVVKI